MDENTDTPLDDDVICLSPEANDDDVFKRPDEERAPQHQRTATFKDKTIENLMKKSTSTGSKINESAVKVTGELLRIYSMELLTRAAEQAMKEDGGSSAPLVTTDHLEKVLAQFLLDFN